MMRTVGWTIDKVIELRADEKKLCERVTGRLTHPASGRSYHIKFKPPKVPGKDDITGEQLMQRKDDTKKALIKRLSVYRKQTMPILEYYRRQNKLVTVDAMDKMENVKQQIMAGIEDIKWKKV